MFGKPKYESDIDQTVRDMWWGFAIFITVMYFLVKATYYVALPFYTINSTQLANPLKPVGF